MARYPAAFETWYAEQVRYRAAEFDNIIIRMRDAEEVRTLAEGERRFRRMLHLQWQIETGRMKA